MKKYRPADGIEMEMFEAEFCNVCRNNSEEKPCEILEKVFAYPVADKRYPVEWIYSVEACNHAKGIPIDMSPKCTKFAKKKELAALGIARKGGKFEIQTKG